MGIQLTFNPWAKAHPDEVASLLSSPDIHGVLEQNDV